MGTVAEHQSVCKYSRALHEMEIGGVTDILAHAEVVAIQADIAEQACSFIESGHCVVADLMVRATLNSPDTFRKVIR